MWWPRRVARSWRSARDVDGRRPRSARRARARPGPGCGRRSPRPCCRRATSTADSAAGSPPGWPPPRRRCSRARGSGSRPSTSPWAPSRPRGPCTRTRGSAPRRRWPRAGASPPGRASRSRSRSPSRPISRVGDREERLVVAGQVVRARVDLVRDPRVDLAVLVEDALRARSRQVVLKTTPGQRRVRLQHRARLDVDAVLARLAPRCGRCARSGSGPPASRAAPPRVAKTGAAWANSGNTTRRTGRNGAAPASAESIIDSMRSVFAAHLPPLDRVRRGRSGRRRPSSGCGPWWLRAPHCSAPLPRGAAPKGDVLAPRCARSESRLATGATRRACRTARAGARRRAVIGKRSGGAYG